ncbi:MAG: transcriptional regulator [Betaproteobacteria bacterium HGW-Betaproteobacteria-3]|jgi:DNA-binding transcriptional ArsR family regulator|nr:MAG: transcriptional regulator [Betaproteobacteria bacterium HGW-Betaproteobacteria-3]
MEIIDAPSSASTSGIVRALAALAQPQRLAAFRALVVAGPQGLTPGVMAAQLGVAPSGLSFHLKELTHAGLVSSEPQGRHLIYRAEFARMNAVLAYLTEHCCQGQACEVTDISTSCTTPDHD